MSDVQTRIGILPVVEGGGAARGELAALWREFRDGKMSVEEFNSEMRNTSGAIYAQRRAVMLMRTAYRNQRAALYEAMRGFRAVARIGRTITSTYQTYTLMQTRVADRTRDVKDTQEDLIKIQERRIQVVGDLGATNAIALRLINEEERLTKRLTEERRDLKRAQDQNIIGYVGIGLQTLMVIPNIVALARHVTLTRTYLGETWSYAGLTGIVASAWNAEVALLGVSTTIGTISTLLAVPLAVLIGVEWLTGYPEVITFLEGMEDLMFDWWVDLGTRLRTQWDDFLASLGGPPPPPGFGPGDGFGGGGGGVRDGDEPRPGGGFGPGGGGWGGDVNVDGGDFDVDVDITITPHPGGGGSGSRLR